MLVMLGAALCLTACGSDDDSGGGAEPDASGQEAPDENNEEGGSPDTFARVTSIVVGTAVGGSTGEEDQSVPFSETIRNSDGSCVGRSDDVDGGVSTEGLESGASVVFLDIDDDVEIGRGTIDDSSWSDPSDGGEQWICVFSFSGEIEGTPDEFRMQVGDIEPWVVSRDLTRPDEWIASVNSVANPELAQECASPTAEITGDWGSVVGQYWNDGFNTLCFWGFTVGNVERVCRPPGFGSDRIVMVTNLDESEVYEDQDGKIFVDAGSLPLFTELTVFVTTGEPCG